MFRGESCLHTEGDSAMNLRSLGAQVGPNGPVSSNSGVLSSAGEHDLHTVGVAGSIPAAPTILDGWVYFIKVRGVDLVKIGWSLAPDRRFEQIANGVPFELQFVAGRRGSRADEAAYHGQFKHLRLKGEWFQSDRELRAVIRSLVKTHRTATPWSEAVITALKRRDTLHELDRLLAYKLPPSANGG